MRIYKVFLLSLVLISNIYSQGFAGNFSPLNTFKDVHEGIISATEWYDLPLIGALYYRNIVNGSNIGDKIIMTPASYERELSDLVGETGRFTPGSMDKNLLPDMIIYTRFASLIVADFINPEFASPRSFQKVFLFQKSLTYTYIITEYTKNLIKRTRPDGTNDRSFFSGHTSTTFAAATFLWLESNELFDNWEVTKHNDVLRKSLKTASLSLFYGWASYVGYSRIRDKKHYVSDVLVGAAVGSFISWFLFDKYLANQNLPADFQLFQSDKSLNIGFKIKL